MTRSIEEPLNVLGAVSSGSMAEMVASESATAFHATNGVGMDAEAGAKVSTGDQGIGDGWWSWHGVGAVLNESAYCGKNRWPQRSPKWS